MKKKLIKFFEIGKLERGLFRIWIILSIVWVGYAYLYSSEWNHEIKTFNQSVQTTLNLDVYCKPQYFQKPIYGELDGTKIQIGWKKTDAIIYGHVDLYRTYVRFIETKTFMSYEECREHYRQAKNAAFKEAFPIFVYTFLIPFIVAIFYLFLKKLFLWTIRGFK